MNRLGLRRAIGRASRIALIVAFATTLMAAGGVSAAAPSNDSIVTPQVISNSFTTGTTGQTTTEATFAGEPTPTCSSVGKTVWWRYRPEVPQIATLSTLGSNFDTVLAVYRSTPDGLVQVACNDDFESLQSRVSFTAQVANYYFQVGGYASASGQIQFNYRFEVAHDAFAKATKITPGYSASFSSNTATLQAGEPNVCSQMASTVWYRFRPSANRRVVFDTLGSNFDTVITVWRGSSLGGLTYVGCADDTPGSTPNESLSWLALADTTYYIQVGGWNGQQYPYGRVNVSFTRLP